MYKLIDARLTEHSHNSISEESEKAENYSYSKRMYIGERGIYEKRLFGGSNVVLARVLKERELCQSSPERNDHVAG